MKQKLLSLCKIIFALGFWISAVSLGTQTYQIWISKSSENVSFTTFLIFALLNTNSILFGKYIVKDSLLVWGAIANLLVCLVTVVLMQIY